MNPLLGWPLVTLLVLDGQCLDGTKPFDLTAGLDLIRHEITTRQVNHRPWPTSVLQVNDRDLAAETLGRIRIVPAGKYGDACEPSGQPILAAPTFRCSFVGDDVRRL